MSTRHPNNQYYVDEQLLNVFQAEKQQIHKMKQQNRILNSLNEKVLKKDQQIEQLQKLVKKYKKYYEQYDLLKATINQRNKQFDRLTQENKLLFNQMNKMMTENKQLQQKLLNAQKLKHEFVKQRNSSDARFRGIQQTFRQYQQQCRSKQKELIRDLEKSKQQVKQLNSKIEDLQTVKFQNEQLKNRINITNIYKNQKSYEGSAQKISNQHQQNIIPNRNQSTNYNPLTFQSNSYSNPRSHVVFSKSRQKSPNKSSLQLYDQEMSAQIERLRRQIINKQMQLQRSKALNHELSIQFDKSVSKICEFQKQLSMYRKQNHQLKKTLSLFVQKQQYEKIHKNRLNRNSQTSQGSQQQEQDEVRVGKNSRSQFSDSYR